MKVLLHALGLVKAERFIALPNCGKLDYTKWRRQQWMGETVVSLAEKAHALRNANDSH